MPNSNVLDHICVDIETLSTRSNAVIVAIAAVKFNFTSDETETFCLNVNPVEGKELGLHISKETLDWWRAQKPEACKAWMNSQLGLRTALDQLDEFCGSSKNTIYYSKGINFDFTILDSSYEILDRQSPWKFWNLRDIRTIYWLAGFDSKKEDRIEKYNNTLDDCFNQITHLKKIIGAKP